MKKLIALLMVLCMLLALAACGNQADAPTADAPAADAPAADAPAADDQVTISWAVRETDNYPLSLYDEMVANFMRDNPDIKVEIVSQGPLGTENEWLKTQLAAGTLPDVILDANIFTASPGALLEMPDHIKDLFLEGTLAQVEGSYCLVPATTQYRMQCYYNKEYFEAAGVEIPTTWEEVIAACEKLEAAGYIPLIAPGTPDAWACSYMFWSSNCNADLMAAYPNFNTDLLAGNVK